MILTNENNFFKTSKCNSVQCEDELLYTCPIQEHKNDFSCSVLKSASDQSINIEGEKYSPSFTDEIINSNDSSSPKYEKIEKGTDNFKIDGISPCQNHFFFTNEDQSTLFNTTCSVKNDSNNEIQNRKMYCEPNLCITPEESKLGVGNEIMIVNYQFARKGATEEPKNVKERTPNISLNENPNTKPPCCQHNKQNYDSKQPHLQSQEKPKEKTENTGKGTFNMMNEEQKQENNTPFHKLFPHHLESSFITKEFKTSFFDDFVDPNAPYFSYAGHETFGCSSDCLGMKLATNFQMPTEKIVHIPVPSYYDYNPQVCYMEPKCCSMSCQGIPYRNQRCGIFQREPKVYPESIIPNSCCNNFMFSEDAVLNETDMFQDITSHQRHMECCTCKKPTDFHLRNKPPETKKKKCFACCKSGKVDQEELSSKSKPTVEKREQYIQCKRSDQEECFTHLTPCSVRNEANFKCCVPPNISYIRSPFPPKIIPNQRIHTDTHFKCDRNCPLKVQPEKESQLRSQPITKSVACECGDKQPPIGFNDDKIDVGRNITIQIMPCGPPARVCSEHRNIAVVACPKVVEKITYPINTCCEEKLLGKPNEQVWYQPYMRDLRSPVRYNDQDHYQGDKLKEKPFTRWWNCNWRSKKPSTPYQRIPNQVERRDCCTTTCQEFDEGDFETVTITNCQRVLPIKNTYINRDGNLLKSLHRLNKGLLNDLFATPCPSSSSACQYGCSRKIRGAPYPVCATANPLCYAAKPQTIHQGSQYEPDCNERVKTFDSSKDILFECLKYLKNGAQNDNQCDYVDEDCCCCCCCQSFHNCCCCHRTPRCCESKEILAPKVEEKKSKSCRCRSVEAKQSCKNCGTIVSNHCFTKVETVCTNTEIRPKTPKPKMKRRVCCKRRCCCCCNQNRNCCCCCDQCCYSEPTTCCRKVRKGCYGEHLIYRCECETNPVFSSSNLASESTEMTQNAKDTSLEKCIELLTSRINDKVSKETLLSNRKENANAKSSEYSNTTEKSTSTTKDVVIKTITLDLCDLGEKKFSKFGVPSRQYPWTINSLLSDMPHEIYRFVGIDKIDNNPLIEKVYDDPTPCLKPQVLHDDDQNEINEQNAGGDIEKLCEVKKRYLSTICEALFDNKQRHNTTKDVFFIRDKRNNFSDLCNNSQIENKHETHQNGMDEGEKHHPVNFPEDHKTIEDTLKLADDKAPIKQDETIIESKKHKPSKSISKTSQSISKVSSNISKKTSNISKASSNISRTSTNMSMNYTPKPFTTKTGLMSFIPSFRDTSRISPQMKKNKKKTTPTLKTENNANISESQNKNKVESKTGKDNHSLSNEIDTVPLNMPKPTSQNEEVTNDQYETEILITKDMQVFDKGDLEEKKKEEEELRADLLISKQVTQTNKTFDLKKFNEEMHAFYEKCFKSPNISTADKIIPFYNASVSDIIKSLESRSSVNFSQMNTQEGNETNSSPTLTDQKSNDNITFPCRSNVEFYSEVFQRSYESSNMKIPKRIMSKSDLISLN
ncbi:uncharacterized protein LOC123306660 [Coccinella septempunctata]|uniref:uncharacterized protein LOC123306660 n=1 Tax=Coccinella septempunctata TaxID=41139 RepID=UPI001D0737C9|nr:uncharacterized protein LOC123306660 [Coccinella septempunctata]